MATKKKTTPTKKATAKTSTEVKRQSAKLTKSSTDKVICGVAGGLAKYFNIDTVLIRLLFVFLLASGGSGFFIYITFCLLLPEEGSENKTTKEVFEENAQGVEKTAKNFAAEAEEFSKKQNTHIWVGIIIILIGISLFFSNLGVWDIGTVIKGIAKALWPLAIIGTGVVILVKNQQEN